MNVINHTFFKILNFLFFRREVDYEEAQNFAKENGLEYIETSAKTGENIDESFLKVSKIIHSKILKNEIDPYDDVKKL